MQKYLNTFHHYSLRGPKNETRQRGHTIAGAQLCDPSQSFWKFLLEGPCRNQFRRGFLSTLNDFFVLRSTANNIKIGPQDKRAALTVKLKRQINSTLD